MLIKTMNALILAAAISIVGCQSGGASLSETPLNKSSKIEDTKSTSSNLNSVPKDNPANQDQTKGQSETSKGQDDKPRFVPERVFQVSKLQKAKIKVGKHPFNLWVMDTDSKRQEGMMFLKDSDFKDDEGMVFVFAGEDERRFWMHNTLVDLDICYCDMKGKIIKTYTMAKLDETTDYSSQGGSMYVIELKAGILKKLGIEKGMAFEIPEDVVSKDN